MEFIYGDALAEFIADASIDLIVTSPPYWRKRLYGVKGELGRETTKRRYLARLLSIVRSWKRLLKKDGSIFINLGDTIARGALQNIPGEFALGIQKDFRLIHRIYWVKPHTIPSPVKNRLNQNYEYVFQLAGTDEPFLDIPRFQKRFGIDAATLWEIPTSRTFGDHPAPFPLGLVERCVYLACPAGGVVFDPFVGSGTVFEIEKHFPATVIGSDLKMYERTRATLAAPLQKSLF